jgi:hypothetical protein
MTWDFDGSPLAAHEPEEEGMKPRLLILENPWANDFADNTTVKPFLDGWAQLTRLPTSYRRSHDAEDLSLWLEAFVQDAFLKICYIAGHGTRGRLAGLTKGINLKGVAAATKKRGPTGPKGTGILLGACEVGTRLDRFLGNCGSRIDWVAGYARDVPWIEATLSDLLFIEYMMRGRALRSESGFRYRKGVLASRRPSSAAQAADWVKEDYPLAAICGFDARDRR